MESVECFILLISDPLLAVESNLDYVFSVGPVIILIFNHLCRSDQNMERYLKECTSAGSCVLLTSLNMFYKDFSRMENLTKLALHRTSMFYRPLH